MIDRVVNTHQVISSMPEPWLASFRPMLPNLEIASKSDHSSVTSIKSTYKVFMMLFKTMTKPRIIKEASISAISLMPAIACQL